jgi:hypothetical protein
MEFRQLFRRPIQVLSWDLNFQESVLKAMEVFQMDEHQAERLVDVAWEMDPENPEVLPPYSRIWTRPEKGRVIVLPHKEGASFPAPGGGTVIQHRGQMTMVR